MVTMVHRTFECGFGHRWRALCEKGSPPPSECMICDAIVKDAAIAPARSDTMTSPAIRGKATRSLQHIENLVLKRPHFDDGSPMATNMRDNTREGEIAAMPETVANNSIARIVKEDQERAKAGQPTGQWGWQDPRGAGGMVGNVATGDKQAVTRLAGKQQVTT